MPRRIVLLPLLVCRLFRAGPKTACAASWVDGVWGPDAAALVDRLAPDVTPEKRAAQIEQFGKGVARHARIDTEEKSLVFAYDDKINKYTILRVENPDADTVILHTSGDAEAPNYTYTRKRLPGGAIGIEPPDGGVIPWARR